MTASKGGLTVVPDLPPAAELEELSPDELARWLRRMMGISRELCDAIDAVMGPPRPARRPELTVIPGGAEVEQ
jgi:diadenosine tetraphosphate (Ap4A) HIT family hydrolase